MKILIILTLMLKILISEGLSGKLDLEIDSSKDSVEGGLRYFYSLSTIVGEPRAECTAQWSISKVHFNSIRDVGENLTYDVCSGTETSSCVPEEIMGKAGIVNLSLLGSGYGGTVWFSYLFGAGVMSKPKVVSSYYRGDDMYGKKSINTPWSTNWDKSFLIPSDLSNPWLVLDGSKYFNKEAAQEIMFSHLGTIYFKNFKIEEIRFNLSEIRLYIQKREKDKKSKKKLDDFDDLLASTEDTNGNSNSSSDDMFDDTPQGRQSNDNNNMFDDTRNTDIKQIDLMAELDQIETLEQSQLNKKKRNKKLAPFKKDRDEKLKLCEKDKPFKNFHCSMSYQHAGLSLSVSYRGESSKKAEARYARWRKRKAEERAEYNEEVDKVCNKEKLEWNKYTYTERLQRWEVNRDQCIQKINNNYQNNVNRLDDEEKSIDNIFE